jgi:hypothetical protein
MLRTLALLLPALIPSWRFFPRVTASPRIEFALLGTADEEPQRWQEFRPRPAYVPMRAMLGRLFWNPRGNETLFLVSSSERFLYRGLKRSRDEIVTRMQADLLRSGIADGARHFQMRLVLVSREQDRLVREVVYRSASQPLRAPPSP